MRCPMFSIETVINDLRTFEYEAEWFEFKENWFDADQLGQYISALSNAAAFTGRSLAYFVWGINDSTHEITGTSFNYNRDVRGEPLIHYLERQLTPDLNFIFRETTMFTRRVVVLSIPAAKTVPTAYQRIRYIRIGSSKERLDKYPERESYLFSILRNGYPTIENTESNYQDLTFERLLTYYNIKGISLNKDTFKKNLGLLTTDGKYNIMAQLLSDNSHVPIRFSIFSGKSKSDKLYSIREFGYQCLLYSLDEVLQYGDVLNLIQVDETNRIVERKDIPLFENRAFREAIINAFLHNNWLSGNEPMFTFFSDRIEILSRGFLPPDQTIEGFFAGESIPVNHKLSEIFLQLHISEKTGRGVPVITNLYGKKAFEFHENSIMVTIPLNHIHSIKDNPEEESIPSKSTSGIKPQMTKTQARILSEIRNNPNMTISQIALALNLSKSTINKSIAALKRIGILHRQGAKRKGLWLVSGYDMPTFKIKTEK